MAGMSEEPREPVGGRHVAEPESTPGRTVAMVLAGGLVFVVMLAVGGLLTLRLLGSGEGSGSAPEPLEVAPRSGTPSADPSDLPSNPEPLPDPSDTPTPTPTTSAPSPTAASTTEGKPRRGDISLTIRPGSAAVFEPVTVSGQAALPDGAVLTLQIKQGSGWLDDTTTFTVSGGRFEGSYASSFSGLNTYRVIEKISGFFSTTATLESY